jgi:CHAD domain-containing protein
MAGYAKDMVTTLDEIERKHEGTRLTTDLFAGLPSVAAALGPDHHRLDATYFDTADLRLAEAGVTMRRRTGGEDAGWHVKLPVGPERRREVHLPLTEADDTVPTELSSLLVGHTGGRALRRCARITTERDRWQLVDANGGVLAEVVSDEVTGQAFGRQGRPAKTWQETEVELHEGRPALLEQVSRRLAEAGAPRSDRPSKLARVLRTHRGATQPELGRKASSAEVVGRYLADQVSAMRAADVALRLDEPEALHDLRVSIRRLRSCLRVFRKLFLASGIRTVSTELAWLSGVLGEARDVEVLRERISRSMHALPDELVLGPVWAELDRLLAKREARTMATVHETISGPRYLALQNSLDNLLVNQPYRPKAQRSAKKVLPRQVKRSYRKVRSSVDEASSVQGDERATALHNVRKKVKRLRYSCEAVEPVIGKPAKKIKQRSKRIQRLLGDHHDSVDVRTTLRELGSRAKVNGSNGFTFGLVHGQLGERATHQEQEFDEQWRRLATSKARKWMR